MKIKIFCTNASVTTKQTNIGTKVGVLIAEILSKMKEWHIFGDNLALRRCLMAHIFGDMSKREKKPSANI